MKHFDHGGLSVEVPANWSESTTLIYGLAGPGGALDPFVCLALSPRTEGETLEATLDSALGIARASREGFHLLERKESQLGGLPAMSARFTSRIDGRVVEEWVTFVVLRRQGHDRTAMLSAMLREDAQAETRALCEQVLESVRFTPDPPSP